MTLEQFEQKQAEDAFAWTLRYIADHGVSGRVKLGRLIFQNDEYGREVIIGSHPDTPAPVIPTLTASALQELGGDVRRGLERAIGPRPNGYVAGVAVGEGALHELTRHESLTSLYSLRTVPSIGNDASPCRGSRSPNLAIAFSMNRRLFGSSVTSAMSRAV